MIRKSKSVLILDDDPRICEELEEFLSRKGYQVFRAELPSSAFLIMEQHTIDLLFLDFALPEMDGRQVLAKVTQQHLETKVIMISGNIQRSVIMELKKEGAIGCIKKPFLHVDVNEILEKIVN